MKKKTHIKKKIVTKKTIVKKLQKKLLVKKDTKELKKDKSFSMSLRDELYNLFLGLQKKWKCESVSETLRQVVDKIALDMPVQKKEKTRQVSFRLPIKSLNKLNKISKKHNQSVGEIIKKAIREQSLKKK